MTGRRYPRVLPEPVAAANATLRTGGIEDADSSAFGPVDDTSTSNDEDEVLLLSSGLALSGLAILSAHPASIAGTASRCTGVGPSTSPSPPASVSRTTASTSSVSSPSFPHSSVPSREFDDDMAAGRESSADVRGDEKGSELRPYAESSFVAAADAGASACDDVEYGGGRDWASSSQVIETPSGLAPSALLLPGGAPRLDSDDVMALRPRAAADGPAFRNAAAAGDRIRATAIDAAMVVTPAALAPLPLVLAPRLFFPISSSKEEISFVRFLWRLFGWSGRFDSDPFVLR